MSPSAAVLLARFTVIYLCKPQNVTASDYIGGSIIGAGSISAHHRGRVFPPPVDTIDTASALDKIRRSELRVACVGTVEPVCASKAQRITHGARKYGIDLKFYSLNQCNLISIKLQDMQCIRQANTARLCRNHQVCTGLIVPARVDVGIDPYYLVTIKTLCAPVARGFPDAPVRTINYARCSIEFVGAAICRSM